MNANTMTTPGEVRLSYVNVFEPQTRPGSTDAKYGVTVLVPKSDMATKAAIDAAIEAAVTSGVTKCWSGVRPPVPSLPVHDGDGPRPNDGQPYGAECRGCWVFTASSKNAPGVVDANVQPILDPRKVYSGVWGRVNISFFPYNNNGKKGIGCGLNHVQVLRDGEPLVDRVSAEDAFGAPAAPQAPAAPAYPQAPAWGAQPMAPGYTQAPAWGAQPMAPGYTQAPAGAINPFTGQPM